MGTRETGNSHREKQLFHGKFCSLCQPPHVPTGLRYPVTESCTLSQRTEKDPAMTRVCSIFVQLLQFISRAQFETAVAQHQSERHARGFSSWTQFVAMLF